MPGPDTAELLSQHRSSPPPDLLLYGIIKAFNIKGTLNWVFCYLQPKAVLTDESVEPESSLSPM